MEAKLIRLHQSSLSGSGLAAKLDASLILGKPLTGSAPGEGCRVSCCVFFGTVGMGFRADMGCSLYLQKVQLAGNVR